MSSAPSTPTRRARQSRHSHGSPSDALARARAALLSTPGMQRVAATVHSSPLSSGSPGSPESSPPRYYKSPHTTPVSSSSQDKRVFSTYASSADRRFPADDDEDWRQRAQSNGIKVANESDGTISTQSDDSVLLPSPALGSSQTSDGSSLSGSSDDELKSSSLFSTPPRTTSQLRGSMTDPPPRVRTYSLNSPPQRERNYSESSFPDLIHSMSDSSLDSLPPVPALSSPRSGRMPLKPSPYLSTNLPSEPSRSSIYCSVCGNDSSLTARFSYLEPCQHLICSSCLTGSLNIVREKDMTCMLCKAPVEDFKLLSAVPDDKVLAEVLSKARSTVISEAHRPKAADVYGANLGPRRVVDISGTRTPASALSSTVLRVDNVPWDLTPAMLAAWAGQPVVGAYTLIDRTSGKTFSHAFVEFSSSEQARTVLRRLQNSVLGKGRRTMAVTVTMSSPEELMSELYPTWPGLFYGANPVALTHQKHAHAAQYPSLLSHKELDSLLTLLENPNPRFVKSPALPFYELIGIMKKIPKDWTTCLPLDVRDHLEDLCLYALDFLRCQLQQNRNHPDLDLDLILDLDHAISHCPAFPPTRSRTNTASSSFERTPTKAYSPPAKKNEDIINLFAQEFHLPPNLVASLADRLKSSL